MIGCKNNTQRKGKGSRFVWVLLGWVAYLMSVDGNALFGVENQKMHYELLRSIIRATRDCFSIHEARQHINLYIPTNITHSSN